MSQLMRCAKNGCAADAPMNVGQVAVALAAERDGAGAQRKVVERAEAREVGVHV